MKISRMTYRNKYYPSTCVSTRILTFLVMDSFLTQIDCTALHWIREGSPLETFRVLSLWSPFFSGVLWTSAAVVSLDFLRSVSSTQGIHWTWPGFHLSVLWPGNVYSRAVSCDSHYIFHFMGIPAPSLLMCSVLKVIISYILPLGWGGSVVSGDKVNTIPIILL